MVQVKFKDLDGLEYGGIQLDDGDVICGCCGGLFTADEIGPLEDGNEIEMQRGKTLIILLDYSEKHSGGKGTAGVKYE